MPYLLFCPPFCPYLLLAPLCSSLLLCSLRSSLLSPSSLIHSHPSQMTHTLSSMSPTVPLAMSTSTVLATAIYFKYDLSPLVCICLLCLCFPASVLLLLRSFIVPVYVRAAPVRVVYWFILLAVPAFISVSHLSLHLCIIDCSSMFCPPNFQSSVPRMCLLNTQAIFIFVVLFVWPMWRCVVIYIRVHVVVSLCTHGSSLLILIRYDFQVLDRSLHASLTSVGTVFEFVLIYLRWTCCSPLLLYSYVRHVVSFHWFLHLVLHSLVSHFPCPPYCIGLA